MNFKLKIQMIKKGVKNFDLAKHLNCDPAKISKIVNGWIDSDDEMKRKISNYLGVEVEKLFTGNIDAGDKN